MKKFVLAFLLLFTCSISYAGQVPLYDGSAYDVANYVYNSGIVNFSEKYNSSSHVRFSFGYNRATNLRDRISFYMYQNGSLSHVIIKAEDPADGIRLLGSVCLYLGITDEEWLELFDNNGRVWCENAGRMLVLASEEEDSFLMRLSASDGQGSYNYGSSSSSSGSTGTTKTHTTKRRKCARCNGTGKITCTVCSGRGGGYVYNENRKGSGSFYKSSPQQTWKVCTKCKGTSIIQCNYCYGKGYLEYLD